VAAQHFQTLTQDPREIADMGSEIRPPGAIMVAPSLGVFTAATKNWLKLKLNLFKTRRAISVAPKRSKIALIICTQVVANIPQKVTYKIIKMHTIISGVR